MTGCYSVIGRVTAFIFGAILPPCVGAGPALAQRDAIEPVALAAHTRVVIRDVADGPGPSHLVPVGDYVLVVDPWAAEIQRYSMKDPAGPSRRCKFPRGFAPGRIVRTAQGVRLVAEPYGPEPIGRGYHLIPRQTMTITEVAVRGMPNEGACRFPIGRYRPALDRSPVIAWSAREEPGATAALTLPGGKRARISPIGGRGAQIFSVRAAGTLSAGRQLIWWSQIDGFPAPAAAGGTVEPGFGGRVTASQYVGIVGASGGRPGVVIRIQTAIYPVLTAGMAMAAPRLLVKPGLEFIAGATLGGHDTLWIASADMNAPAPRPFVLRGYSLDGLSGGTRALVALVEPGSISVDRNDAAVAVQPKDAIPVAAGPTVSRADWFAAAARTLRAQVGFRWRYPIAALARACGGADRCAVGANAAGALGMGSDFPGPVHDRIDTGGGANWMRPRYLIGAAAGEKERGIPYSIGGMDLAGEFATKLAASYAAGTPFPPPIGHIREGLEWAQAEGNYPLGIDCSALVAQVFQLAYRATAEMVAPRVLTAADGKTYAVPNGPAHACPQPVGHVSEVRKGDLFLRDGHVVIFAGIARGAYGRGFRVFEASSRCGKVCESIYDPTYFDGWWIIRLSLGRDGKDCPNWLDRAPHIVP